MGTLFRCAKAALSSSARVVVLEVIFHSHVNKFNFEAHIRVLTNCSTTKNQRVMYWRSLEVENKTGSITNICKIEEHIPCLASRMIGSRAPELRWATISLTYNKETPMRAPVFQRKQRKYRVYKRLFGTPFLFHKEKWWENKQPQAFAPRKEFYYFYKRTEELFSSNPNATPVTRTRHLCVFPLLFFLTFSDKRLTTPVFIGYR